MFDGIEVGRVGRQKQQRTAGGGDQRRRGRRLMEAGVVQHDHAARRQHRQEHLREPVVGVLATLLTVAIGALVGLAAGYFGRIVDTVLARVVDVMLSIPFLLFAISLASIVSVTPLHIGPIKLQQGIGIVVIVIGTFSWATVARIVRGQVSR